MARNEIERLGAMKTSDFHSYCREQAHRLLPFQWQVFTTRTLLVGYSHGTIEIRSVFDVTMCQSNYTQVDSMKLCQ